jgi:hypothetical protein
MGRPLKIQKRSTGSGNGGAAVNVDIGYPNFGSLTDPVFNSPVQTLNDAQYVGVVGGASSAATSATNPRTLVEVNITLASGSGAGSAAGYIIRQKGSHKYLVGDSTSRTALVVGNAYRIITVGTANWTLYGAPAGYAAGTIFTCTVAVGTIPGSGAANLVGVCVLSDAASPTSGNMSIAYINDASSEVYVSKLTNRFMLGWEGGSNYAATSVVADVRGLANFFTDEGTMIKSGTTGAANTGSAQSGQQNLLNLTLIQNATS